MNRGRGWRFAAASVTGTSHLAASRGCDDACRCEIVTGADGSAVLLAAVADGAGSAQAGARGSALACSSIIEQVRVWLAAEADPGALSHATARNWLEGVRESIAEEAGLRDMTLRDFATTLLLAVVGQDAAALLHVGDGAIVVKAEESSWLPASWPQHGTHAGETYFVTDSGADERISLTILAQPVCEIALFTDGLERLLLNHAQKTAQAAAFERMLAPLRASAACGEDVELSGSLGRYLASEAVSRRTDDDVTLIMASRVPVPA